MLLENTQVLIKSKPITIQCRNNKGFNESNFKRDIKSVPWHFVGSYDDPIKASETWKTFFLQIDNKHAPIKKRRIRLKSMLLGLLLKLRI
jgi:hypothetical protein